MKTSVFIAASLSATLMTACSQPELGVMQFAPGSVQHVVRANSAPWTKCPPSLPDGCEIAILEGHPKKPDLFTIRFKTSKKLYMPPHTHPKDERVTILRGKVAVAFGKDARRKDAKEFGPGDYYVNSRNEVHIVWIDPNSILQLTGIGPWEVNYVKTK